MCIRDRVPVQYGGGIRDVESVEAILSSGIDRVIVGTAAIETPEIIEEMLTQFGNDFLVISIDARGNKVALHGWTTQTQITTSDVIQKIDSMGIRRFIYTDISRDGTLTEPNFDSVQDFSYRKLYTLFDIFEFFLSILDKLLIDFSRFLVDLWCNPSAKRQHHDNTNDGTTKRQNNEATNEETTKRRRPSVNLS